MEAIKTSGGKRPVRIKKIILKNTKALSTPDCMIEILINI